MGMGSTGQSVSIGPLMAGVVAAALAGALIGCGMGAGLGWTSGSGLATASVLAWVSVVSTMLIQLVMVASAIQRRSKNFGLVAVTAGKLRSMASLGVGIVLYMTFSPDGRTFWTGFLAAGLLVLAVETAWGMRAARRLGGHVPSGASAGTETRHSELSGAAS